MASKITIFEVGPRDGLQNENRKVSFEDKLFFIQGLVAAGARELEAGAFVRPDRVPQMADTDQIFHSLRSGQLRLGAARVWSLVPNRKGLERAFQAGARHLALFTAATESFTQRNIGMSIQESLEEFREVIRDAKAQRGFKPKFRGYISTAFGCPFEGKVSAKQTLKVVQGLAKLGVDQISIGDTIGVATPDQVDAVIKPALRLLGPAKVAVHFHDTRGTALANALRALELGIRVFDSSAGGLGGCPFAPGATGNLATEDLVYMMDGLGMKSGIDLQKLCELSLEFGKRIARPVSSRYLQAYQSACERSSSTQSA